MIKPFILYYSSATPDEWESFSNKNILDAEKQRNNSVALRTLIDGILQSTANDMRKQKESVDIALTKRISETRDSKEKLEDHLSKVNYQDFILDTVYEYQYHCKTL